MSFDGIVIDTVFAQMQDGPQSASARLSRLPGVFRGCGPPPDPRKSCNPELRQAGSLRMAEATP